MNTRSVLLLVGLLFATLGLAAEPATKSDKEPAKADSNACAWFSSIDDWRELDDRNLIVWVSKKEFYHVELSMPLFDLSSAPSIAFVDRNRDGRLCGYGMDEVVVPHASVFGSSTIIGMTRLDEAGLQRLAEKYHVKLGGKKQDKPAEAATKAETAKPAEAPAK